MKKQSIAAGAPRSSTLENYKREISELHCSKEQCYIKCRYSSCDHILKLPKLTVNLTA